MIYFLCLKKLVTSTINILSINPITAPSIEIDERVGSIFSSSTIGGSRYEKT